jgi:hypothetical protein
MSKYEVPGMTLIPQTMKMSCWYASAQMLIRWKMDQRQQSLSWLVPPELDAQCVVIRDGDGGVTNPQIVPMATRLGLRAVPPMSPAVETIEGWLSTYGPLWVNGTRHITVIAGVDTEARTVKVYDPAPVNSGRIEWRSLDTWYTGSSSSGRDTGAGVETVFLYVPR